MFLFTIHIWYYIEVYSPVMMNHGSCCFVINVYYVISRTFCFTCVLRHSSYVFCYKCVLRHCLSVLFCYKCVLRHSSYVFCYKCVLRHCSDLLFLLQVKYLPIQYDDEL